MATQGEGASEDRTAASVSGAAAGGASRREPPIIDAQASEVVAPASVDDASVPATGIDATGEESGAASETEAPPRKRRRGLFRYALGAIVALGAVGVAWLVTPDDYGPGDLRTQVVALLPQEAQRAIDSAQTALGGKPQIPVAAPKTPAAPKPLDTPKVFGALPSVPPPAPQERAPAADAPRSAVAQSVVSSPVESKPVENRSAETKPTETKPAESLTATGQSTPAAPQAAAPTVVIGAVESAKLDALAARLEALQAKLDAAPAPVEDKSAARLEALTARLAALEAKLDQPKSDARAPREVAAPAPAADPGAARAVVAQALIQGLGAGAPLGASIEALRNLGAGDDKLADLAPFATAGAPGAAQLAAQWAALRAKIVGADAPTVGDDWTDKWIAKAKSLVKVQPMGALSGASAAAVFSRVEAALQRGDVADALKTSDALPDAAKTIAADWRAAAARRVKAEAAARALLTDSIAALGRSKS